MITRSLALLAVAFAATAAFGQEKGKANQDPPKAKMDEAVADFKLKDVMQDEEKFVTLSEFKDKKVVVLYFVSDKCPITWKYEKRTGKLFEDFLKKDVVFLGVKSSAADTAESIRKYCESKNYEFPVLLDEKNRLADHLGVRVTPIYVVIDKKGILRYKGAFDEKQKAAKTVNDAEDTVKNHYVREALNAILEGKDVTTKEVAGYG